MKLIFLSARLFIYGAFCDFIARICTRITEKNIEKHKPLTKKLLTYMSNFSDSCFVKWEVIEKRFIRLLTAPSSSQ